MQMLFNWITNLITFRGLVSAAVSLNELPTVLFGRIHRLNESESGYSARHAPQIILLPQESLGQSAFSLKN